MPRRVSDYPDAFTGWNFISSIGSVISVAATALFLQIVYLQLVKGKAIYGYIWAVPQLFSDYYRILKDRCSPGLEWALHNPPKPHAFTSLPLQSSSLPSKSDLEKKIEYFESDADLSPNSEDLAKEGKNDPKTIRDCADSHIKEIEKHEEKLLQEIEDNKTRGVLSDSEADDLEFRVQESAYAAKKLIEEANNVSVENIDDSEDTAHLIFDMLPFVFSTGRIAPILALLTFLIKIIFNDNIRYFLSVYYRSYKNIVNSVFIFLILVVSLVIYYSLYIDFINCDAPRAWGLYFQDSASPQMEALVELHDDIMFYLVAILFSVAWIQASIIKYFNYTKYAISNKYLNHGTLIELIWTITPALILVLIAFPSFKLLYLMDEVTDPSLSVLAEGHGGPKPYTIKI